VPWISLNDRFDIVGSVKKLPKRSSRVTLIGHKVLRPKTFDAKPSFAQNPRGSFRVMYIPCADIDRNGKLVLTVHQQVQFVAVDKLLRSLGALFHRPASVLVGLWGFPAVAPSLEYRSIKRNSLSKARKACVVMANQRTGNIFDLCQIVPLRNLVEEPRKSRVMRDGIRSCDAADLSDEGIVPQLTPQGLSKCQTKDVFCDKALPQDSNGMALRPTSGRANQLVDKSVVVQSVKDSSKLSDNWGRLWGAKDRGRITVGHGKRHLPVRLGGVGVSSTCASAFYIKTSVLV